MGVLSSKRGRWPLSFQQETHGPAFAQGFLLLFLRLLSFFTMRVVSFCHTIVLDS